LIPASWTPQQRQILANYGVRLEDMGSAYSWLQHELAPSKIPRFGDFLKREMAVKDMICRCGLSRRTVNIRASSLELMRSRILITSSMADPESLSCCEVFQMMLQAHLRTECAVVHTSSQMTSWKPWAYYLVVLLFSGTFQDPGFARILLTSISAPGRDLEVVTVLADTHFNFPRELDEEPDGEDVENPKNLDNERLSQAYRGLLKVLALPFSPLASEGLQQQQVVEVAARMRRYQDAAEAATWDEVDDEAVAVELAQPTPNGLPGRDVLAVVPADITTKFSL